MHGPAALRFGSAPLLLGYNQPSALDEVACGIISSKLFILIDLPVKAFLRDDFRRLGKVSPRTGLTATMEALAGVTMAISIGQLSHRPSFHDLEKPFLW